MYDLNFKQYLKNKGYYFDEYLLEDYLLSLMTKPFIILTGNSGTGKTKLPQLFAEYGMHSSNEYYMIKVSTLKRSFSGGNDNKVGWGVYKEYIDRVLPIDMINGKYEIEIGGFTNKADISLGIQLYYDFKREDIKKYFKKLYNKEKLIKEENKSSKVKPEQQMVYLGVSYDSILNLISDDYINKKEITLHPTLTKSAIEGKEKLVPFGIFDYMPFKKEIPCTIMVNGLFINADIKVKLRMRNYATKEIKDYLNTLYINNESHFELKIRGFEHNYKDFKSFMNNALENKNYEIMPVGANWNDNSHIVGYYNVLENKYQSTTANELIRRAQKDPNNPYFLILDEMNLAPVEKYFSDFLSAMESGEEIPLYGNDELLKLPKNLFIIGTVNNDENNYTFLPMVLDRANVIELDTPFVSEYMLSEVINSFKGNLIYLESPLMGCDISLLNIDDLKEILLSIICNEGNLWNILSTEITKFQKILKGSNFEISFRVIIEILRFMVVAWHYENSPKEWNNWEKYFDAQIKQRILPKLYGSDKDIEEIIFNLFKLCCGNGESNIYSITSKKDCKYYLSVLKLQNMYKILDRQGVVSFI